jgi:hypothetical protein
MASTPPPPAPPPPAPQRTLSLVVMAAGMGRRYGGLKQVEPVGPGGQVILDYSVYDALRAGFSRVVFVIRRDIESEFREHMGRRIEAHAEIAYAFQELDALPEGFSTPAGRQKPWGTAHAVLCAKGEVDGPFAAINADDFYGPGAFAAVGSHLAANPDAGGSDEYCMAGYRLVNTLSEHGHVARGVCEVTEDGFLSGIVERTRILIVDGEVKSQEPGGVWTDIPGDSTVSMNIWGFREGFMDHLATSFRAFLERDIDTQGAECYLPSVVNDLIDSGAARVRVLPTDERWFGVTYREDMPTARRAIAERIARGLYPEKLWG